MPDSEFQLLLNTTIDTINNVIDDNIDVLHDIAENNNETLLTIEILDAKLHLSLAIDTLTKVKQKYA